jgi:hypothetical protein
LNFYADEANSWNFYAESLATDDAMPLPLPMMHLYEFLIEHMPFPMMHLYEFVPHCHFELTTLCSTLSF